LIKTPPFDFDQAAGEVEAAIAAAIHHALELFRHVGRAEVTHLDKDAAVRRGSPRSHFRIDGAADHVAGGAFELFVIIAHEALHRAVEQIAAGPA